MQQEEVDWRTGWVLRRKEADGVRQRESFLRGGRRERGGQRRRERWQEQDGVDGTVCRAWPGNAREGGRGLWQSRFVRERVFEREGFEAKAVEQSGMYRRSPTIEGRRTAAPGRTGEKVTRRKEEGEKVDDGVRDGNEGEGAGLSAGGSGRRGGGGVKGLTTTITAGPTGTRPQRLRGEQGGRDREDDSGTPRQGTPAR
ncbi:hypothetical protein Dda_4714 [Drechslerella dactyloides]|uniref:Uncharacterized protein n=1 Tax=Drechslerella dactyloides TaxID=74499 RepID=A0AAD6IXG9_DREDA|nr:hypothetical protein Dda_4714 [Drechslerella dactyloides]